MLLYTLCLIFYVVLIGFSCSFRKYEFLIRSKHSRKHVMQSYHPPSWKNILKPKQNRLAFWTMLFSFIVFKLCWFLCTRYFHFSCTVLCCPSFILSEQFWLNANVKNRICHPLQCLYVPTYSFTFLCTFYNINLFLRNYMWYGELT